ncbi:MAG: hypothetical protein ACP6IP_04860 [Candidatus Njordarchaeia archaeon]
MEMNLSDVIVAVISLINLYYNNYPLLLITWLIYILIRLVWGGLSRLLTLMLFPGTLLYVSIKYLVAKKLDLEISPVMLIKSTYETAGGLISLRSPKDTIIMGIVDILSAITLTVTSFLAVQYFENTFAKIILIWLGASFFITGLPREVDFYAFLTAIWAIEPLGVLAFLVSIAVFVTGLEAYDVLTAIFATIIYLVLVTVILMTYKMPKERDEGDILVLDEELGA